MNYEAPKAEMIEMQMPVVLAETVTNSGGDNPGPGSGAPTSGSDPIPGGWG